MDIHKTRKRFCRQFICISSLLLLAGTASALEYQWKFFLPTMTDADKGARVFDLIHAVPGIIDVDINVERRNVMFFFNDEKTDEEIIKKRLQDAGFPIKKMLLLEEPIEGVMN